MQERVGNFLAGLTSRRYEVRRRCRTVLQSRAEALPRDYRTDSQHPPQLHIPPWSWFRLWFRSDYLPRCQWRHRPGPSAAVIVLLTKPWFYNDGLPNLVPDLSLSAAGELSREVYGRRLSGSYSPPKPPCQISCRCNARPETPGESMRPATVAPLPRLRSCG